MKSLVFSRSSSVRMTKTSLITIYLLRLSPKTKKLQIYNNAFYKSPEILLLTWKLVSGTIFYSIIEISLAIVLARTKCNFADSVKKLIIYEANQENEIYNKLAIR